MKIYKHIGQTLDPDTGAWGLQAFNNNEDRAFVPIDPDYALILASDLIAFARRHMVPTK